MKIAHFSPLPPQRSGVAAYCAALLPYLAAHAGIDAYSTVRTSNARPIEEFGRPAGRRYRYDACLYHMGNHPAYHDAVYATLLRYPGVAVLHDLNLHAFHLQRAPADSHRAGYVREMGYAHGLAGTAVARQALAGRHEAPSAGYPLFNRVVEVSLGVIVHTEHARQSVLTAVPHARVAYIPLAIPVPDQTAPVARPARLAQLAPGTTVLASFGYVAPGKRIEVVLRALARLRQRGATFCYVLVGEPVPGYDLTPMIDALNLSDVVHQTGFVDEATFAAYLGSVDVAINFRSAPTGGEMSATLLRLLAQGRPVLVSDVDGFAALPDDCVLKIGQGEDEVAQLVATLQRLMVDERERERYSERASAYAQQKHSPVDVAKQYLVFIQHCIESVAG